ncbi:MAG: 3-isopropylmalate dehydratase small subunit [Eubacteriales bacterium]|nr:3-isopropylmalate dehydratase small subunit [Eubacteriales bacterium]
MEPFVKLNGIVAPLDQTNVDTDAIIPKQFLKRIERSGFGQYLFFEMRFDDAGAPNPAFELNKPRYQGTTILVSRANFGCGSSREHAPWALLDYGFRAIIAPSFADIFYNNCLNNGILPIKLASDVVDQIFQNVATKAGYSLEIDLTTKTVSDGAGIKATFQLDDFSTTKLLNGYDDISLTLLNNELITAYENTHPSKLTL